MELLNATFLTEIMETFKEIKGIPYGNSRNSKFFKEQKNMAISY